MARETISINISSVPCYEAGAAFLGAVAYPAANHEQKRLNFWQALCRKTIIDLAHENFDEWSWKHQPIRPGFFTVSDDAATKALTAGFDLLGERMQAGHYYCVPFLKELELGRPLQVRGFTVGASNMANLAGADLGMRDGEKNVLNRIFVPSKPVLHAAAAIQWTIQERYAEQTGIRLGTLLHDPELLGHVVERSEVIRGMIPRLKKHKIEESETIQFVLG